MLDPALVPTVEDIEQAKEDIDDIHEFTTSSNQNFVDSEGNTRKTIAGFQSDAEQAIVRLGWVVVDSFATGATLTNRNQALRYAATGELYRWDGVLPKVVSPGSTPASSGGVGVGAWMLILTPVETALEKVSKKAVLDLDFINGIYKSYGQYGLSEKQLTDIVTTIRATTATYNSPFGINTAAADTARINYNPENGEPSGIIAEGGVTNLAQYSGDFSNSYWIKRSESEVVLSTILAPDNSSFMWKHQNTGTANNGTYIRRNNPTTLDDTFHTFSVFVKRGTKPLSRVGVYSRASIENRATLDYNHDTDTVTILNSGANMNVTGGRIKYKNGIVRLWLRCNTLTGTNTTGWEFVASAWAVPSAIGSEYGYCWGAMVNVGYLQEYIPTVASQQTKAPDNYATAWMNTSEFTLVFLGLKDNNGSGDFTVVGGVGNTFDDTVYLNGTSWSVRAAGLSIGSLNSGLLAGSVNNVALVCKAGRYESWRNGVLVESRNNIAEPSVNYSRVKLLSAPWEASSSSANIAQCSLGRFMAIPYAVSASELQVITA